MKVTREELDDTYGSKETDELVALYREGTLTELAKVSCKALLVERGIDEEALREMEREAAPRMEELWVAMNYKIKRGDQEFGPYSLAELERYVSEGRIAATDLAKSEGMEDWAPISVVPLPYQQDPTSTPYQHDPTSAPDQHDPTDPTSALQLIWQHFRLPPSYGWYSFVWFRILPILGLFGLIITLNQLTAWQSLAWAGAIVLLWLIPRYPLLFLGVMAPLMIYGIYYLAQDLATGRRVLTPYGWLIVFLIFAGLLFKAAEWIRDRF